MTITELPQTQIPTISFGKLYGSLGSDDGEWRIFGPLGSLVEGEEAIVTKRDGSTSTVTVLKVWTDSGRSDNRAQYATFRNGGKPSSLGAKTSTPLPDVPEGYYAVPSRTGNNDLDFFSVDRPSEGRWAGYVFVKRVIGGHVDTPVRGTEARMALEAIVEQGISESQALYGREIGRCGVCNRTLTDELSREIGIGPTCRNR